MKNLSTLELAQYLNVTKRTIQRRAIKEDWAYEERIGLGGTKRLYDFAALPEEIKSKVIAAIIARHEAHSSPQQAQITLSGANVPFIAKYEQDPANWLAQHCFSHKVDNTELNKDYLKLGLLSLARLYAKQSGVGKIKGFDAFCEQYNQRSLEIDDAIYGVIKHISRITLLRWEKREQELAYSTEHSGASQQQSVVMDKELRTIAEEVLMVSPNITAKRLHQHFLTFFADKKIPDERELRIWLKQAKRL